MAWWLRSVVPRRRGTHDPGCGSAPRERAMSQHDSPITNAGPGPAGALKFAPAMAALGAGLLVAPPVARAVDLSARPILVVRESEPGIAFKAPRGIAIDTLHHEIVVSNTDDHRVEFYSLDGARRARYIHRVQGQGGAWVDGVPQALVVDRAGRIYVSDVMAHYVDVVDFRGRSVARVALPDSTPGPGALALEQDGGLLVAERGPRGRVYRFDAAGRARGAWGVPGSEPGQIAAIAGLGVLPNGDVVIAGQTTHFAVQVFSPAGEYKLGFGIHEIGPGNFSLPSGLAVTAGGRIWVSDELRHTVQVFESSGAFIIELGGRGNAPGQFFYPSALASDGGSLVAVTEREGNRFQILRVE
jgi:DNA-binding beta-propeller fold protein YncE